MYVRLNGADRHRSVAGSRVSRGVGRGRPNEGGQRWHTGLRRVGDATGRELVDRLGLARRPMGIEHDGRMWNSIHEQCPVATTERYEHAFMPVTMEAVAAVANDTEHFSSIWVNVGRPDAPRSPAPPITSDPPDHHGHRRLLLPAFSPKNVAPLETDLREYCRALIADLDGNDTAERGRAVRPAHTGPRDLQAHRPARR